MGSRGKWGGCRMGVLRDSGHCGKEEARDPRGCRNRGSRGPRSRGKWLPRGLLRWPPAPRTRLGRTAGWRPCSASSPPPTSAAEPIPGGNKAKHDLPPPLPTPRLSPPSNSSFWPPGPCRRCLRIHGAKRRLAKPGSVGRLEAGAVAAPVPTRPRWPSAPGEKARPRCGVGRLRNRSPEKLGQRGSLASRGRGRPAGQSQGRRGPKNQRPGEEERRREGDPGKYDGGERDPTKAVEGRWAPPGVWPEALQPSPFSSGSGGPFPFLPKLPSSAPRPRFPRAEGARRRPRGPCLWFSGAGKGIESRCFAEALTFQGTEQGPKRGQPAQASRLTCRAFLATERLAESRASQPN